MCGLPQSPKLNIKKNLLDACIPSDSSEWLIDKLNDREVIEEQLASSRGHTTLIQILFKTNLHLEIIGVDVVAALWHGSGHSVVG